MGRCLGVPAVSISKLADKAPVRVSENQAQFVTAENLSPFAAFFESLSEATLSSLMQTGEPLYVPLYTSEKPPEVKGCLAISRASLESSCDDGRASREAQILWSLLWVCLKVTLAEGKLSKIYER